MDKLFKIILLILIALIGYGYGAFNYFTSKDHLDELPEIKGKISEISYFVVSEIRLGNESERHNLFTGEHKAFLKPEEIMNLLTKEQSKNLFGKKVRFIDPHYDSINTSSTLTNHEKEINIDPDLVLTVRHKELDSSPEILIKVNSQNATFSFVPSLRDVTDNNTADDRSLFKLFSDLAEKNIILSIKGGKDFYHSEILNLDIQNVDEIKNQNGEVIYFFPYNQDYETKMSRAKYYTIITTILILFIHISIKFKWKISV